MDYQTIIIAILLAGAAAILAAGRAGLKWGLLIWIGTFALGYRTVQVSPAFRLHPSAVLLVALLLWLALTTSRSARTVWWTPTWLLLLVPFFYWGWVTGRRSGVPWDAMLSELQAFLLFIALTIVLATVLEEKRNWRLAVTVFYGTAIVVAIMGILEVYVPGIRSVFPQFVSNTEGAMGNDGFSRAPFSFWGHPSATFICALAIPFSYPLFAWWPTGSNRWMIFVGLGLLVLGVYISGYRILWALLLLQLVAWFTLSRRYLTGVVLGLTGIASFSVLPQAALTRAESFIAALQGSPTDTSSVKHLHRVDDALNVFWEQPLGLGWTGSGWVHSDFLQLAANLGIVPGLIFALAYIGTCYGVFRLAWTRKSPAYRLHIALLLSLFAMGGIMCTQVVYVLPQQACPQWFVWAMAAIAIRQHHLSTREGCWLYGNISSTAYLQLRTNN